MTVGIAAICDNGNAIVMAADRLASVSEAGLYLEMDNKKIVQLTPHVWMTVAGNLQDSEDATNRFMKASHLVEGQSVHTIARRLRRACERIRSQQIEDRIIQPFLGISYAEFKKLSFQGTVPPVYSEVHKMVVGFGLDLELLLIGVDDAGTHMYRLTHIQVNSYKAMSFTTIGCGRTIAAAELSRRNDSTFAKSVAETAYRVYEAKRAAERTRLVGSYTDILVVRREGKAEFLPSEAVNVLAVTFENHQPRGLSSDELSAIANALPNNNK